MRKKVTKIIQEPVRKGGRPRKKLEDELSKVLTTDRQKAFLKNRLGGMNNRKAAIHAGYAPSTASIMAKRIMDKLAGNRTYIEELERQGLTIPKLVAKHAELLEAMHPFRPDQLDNSTRLKAVEMAFKLWGVFPSRNKKISEAESYSELSIDGIRRAEKYSKEKILIEDHVSEASEDPTREEDESI